MSESFGTLLSRYRRDAHDRKRGGSLTQERLADLIAERMKDRADDNYPATATIHNWEQDQNLPDPVRRRAVLVALVAVLYECGGLTSPEEANGLLTAGRYSALDSAEETQIWGTSVPGMTESSSGSRHNRQPAPMKPGQPASRPGPPPDPPHPVFSPRPSDRNPPAGDQQDTIVRGATDRAGFGSSWSTRMDPSSAMTPPDRFFQPGTAPRPPSLVIGREGDLSALKSRIGIGNIGSSRTRVQIVTAEHASGVTHKTNLAAVRGWPGVGKTTLAAALAYDEDVMAAYPDGVLWVSLGQTPNVTSELATWGRALGVDLSTVKTIEEASTRLAALVRAKRRLLIIDDVWQTADALAFQIGGPECATLITTRDRGVAQALAPTPDDIYRLDVLSDEKALELLQLLAPSVVIQYPKESRELVKELEGLPLALQVAGHLLQVEASLGFSVVTLLADLREGARLLEAEAPADRIDLVSETTPTVAALLKKSTDLLDLFTRDCFAFLAPFAPKPATFDQAALRAVWRMENPEPVVRILVERGLLEPVVETGRFQLHAVLVMHARTLLAKN